MYEILHGDEAAGPTPVIKMYINLLKSKVRY